MISRCLQQGETWGGAEPWVVGLPRSVVERDCDWFVFKVPGFWLVFGQMKLLFSQQTSWNTDIYWNFYRPKWSSHKLTNGTALRPSLRQLCCVNQCLYIYIAVYTVTTRIYWAEHTMDPSTWLVTDNVRLCQDVWMISGCWFTEMTLDWCHSPFNCLLIRHCLYHVTRRQVERIWCCRGS